MASKLSRPMTLFEGVMWGTTKQVQQILDSSELRFDDKWTDYALLISALKRKRKEVVKLLLNKGCRIQKVPRTDTSDTPLHFAVKMGDFDIVKILLEKGAFIGNVDQNGETPLCYAMKNSLKRGNYEIVDLILSVDNIANINATTSSGFSHFHIACMRNNIGIVEAFLKQGVDINGSINFLAKEWPGYTALHFAVDYECLDTVKLLLKYGADVTKKSEGNASPLHLALQKQDEIVVDLILSLHGNKISNPVDKNGLSHFHVACMRNHLDAVKNFLQQGVDVQAAVFSNSSVGPGFTPLHFAVNEFSMSQCSRRPVIDILLRSKADINVKDILGQTPLHLACLQNDKKIINFVREIISSKSDKLNFNDEVIQTICKTEQTEVVSLLLKHKSDVNAKNVYNETPLFYLYKNDLFQIKEKMKDDTLVKSVFKILSIVRKETVKILLDHGADVTVRNSDGETILHLIAGTDNCIGDEQKEEVALLILSRGADVNATDKNGSTPLHIASRNGHAALMEIFLQHNANVDACEACDQATSLHLATYHQKFTAINVLLKYNADVNLTKRNGKNVLHIMAMMNPERSEETEFIESYDKIIKLFIEQGCEINAQDMIGRSPLHWATVDHNNAGIWALLQHFADISVEDSNGETVLAYPLENTQRCVNICFMFKDYVNMMKFTGLPVSRKVDLIYASLYGNDPPDPKDDLMMQCKEEMDRMKNIRINNNTLLFDVMFRNSTEMEVLAGNEIFENLLSSDDFNKNFNIYGNLLKSQFRKGLARKKLLIRAKDSLEYMIKLGLPDSCSGKIFQYLNDEHLYNIIKAKDLTVSKNKFSGQISSYDKNECTSLEKAIAYCQRLFSKQEQMDIT